MSSIIITKSSAGSGKTYNLAIRFLQVLLHEFRKLKNSDIIKHILAITFTKKATAEMRTRILEWMKKIYFNTSIPDNNLLFPQFIKKPMLVKKNGSTDTIDLLSDVPETQLQSTTGQILDYIMTYFDDLKISTIDSFTVFLLRTQAFQLNLPPDFEITLDEKHYKKNLIDALYEDIVSDEKTYNAFAKYLEQVAKQSPKDLHWDIKSKIVENIETLWTMEKSTGKTVKNDYQYYELNINKLKLFQEELLDDAGLKVKTNFKKALDNFFKSGDIDKLSTWIVKTFDNPGTTPSLLNKNSDLPSESLEKKWQNIQKDLKRHVESLSKFQVQGAVNIYDRFKEKKQEFMSQHDKKILISDLNAMLRDILNSENILPIMYYYMAERYSHYLIDEFQDTSSVQWENLEKLVEESFSTNGSLFVVGDMKQAIYRWRGGDASIVNTIKDNVEKYPSIDALYELNLEINYRSAPTLIEFVKNLFDYDTIKANAPNINDQNSLIYENQSNLLTIYKDFNPKISDKTKDKKGYVYFEIIKDDENGYSKDETLEIIKNKVKSDLLKLLEKYDYKDIAFLCRKNAEIQMLVEWLLEFKRDDSNPLLQNLSFQSDQTVSLSHHSLTLEIMAFLKFLDQPYDNLAFLQFINGAIFQSISGLSAEILFEWYNKVLIKNKNPILYKLFKNWQPDLWKEKFQYFFNKVSYVPLYEFIQMLFHKWKIFKHFPDDKPFFLHFLEILLDTTNNGISTISEFIEYFDDPDNANSLQLKVSEDLNAIKILTIHKAKGLEFPVTILPFLDAPPGGGNSSTYMVEDDAHIRLFNIPNKYIPFSSKLEGIVRSEKMREYVDEINTLYVALTRATDALIGYFVDYSKSTDMKDLFQTSFEFKDNIYTTGELPDKHPKTNSEITEEQSFFPMAEEMTWMTLIEKKVKKLDDIFSEKTALFGSAVHSILSQIKLYPDENIPFYIENASQEFELDEKELEKIINTFFKNHDFLKFFKISDSVRVLNECEVVTEKNEMKRIDRLMIYPEKVQIIDFKTGEVYEKKHEHQILEYKKLVESLYDKPVEAFLLYLDEKKLVEV